MTDDEPIEGRQRLPDWVERELARRREYWRVLRDGGAITTLLWVSSSQRVLK
ncbi:hypothetical protein TPB0596_04520 [Tsukamurella pulmonis]|uniref:hypothetical protein n=1 Tax=Tsukamurella pulmonis TaxID=47312 RepID=UPI001EDDF925|nr:hypothetical protein [Tsukamurella pulmonis]BDD80689.1 hypothetical protein TPB0596_04520 [Tsukamurella pulmonis]